MKQCKKCQQQKSLSEFYKAKEMKDGLRSSCKVCMYEADKAWRLANPEHARALTRSWRKSHPEKCKGGIRNWELQNRDKIRAAKRKRYSTPTGKLNTTMSNRMKSGLRGSKSNRHWEDLVGYTIDQLKRHLEKRFIPEMNWGNYGTYWHIDHKIPIAIFNFERPGDIDFKLCWSIKNLQPLEAIKNLSKRAKIDRPFQPSLAM